MKYKTYLRLKYVRLCVPHIVAFNALRLAEWLKRDLLRVRTIIIRGHLSRGARRPSDCACIRKTADVLVRQSIGRLNDICWSYLLLC